MAKHNNLTIRKNIIFIGEETKDGIDIGHISRDEDGVVSMVNAAGKPQEDGLSHEEIISFVKSKFPKMIVSKDSGKSNSVVEKIVEVVPEKIADDIELMRLEYSDKLKKEAPEGAGILEMYTAITSNKVIK